jgi:hypothetical protein
MAACNCPCPLSSSMDDANAFTCFGRFQTLPGSVILAQVKVIALHRASLGILFCSSLIVIEYASRRLLLWSTLQDKGYCAIYQVYIPSKLSTWIPAGCDESCVPRTFLVLITANVACQTLTPWVKRGARRWFRQGDLICEPSAQASCCSEMHLVVQSNLLNPAISTICRP